MDDWRVLTAQAALLCILVAYIIEVVLGSCTSIHHGELGVVGSCDTMKRLSNREFFGRYLPLLPNRCWQLGYCVFVYFPLFLRLSSLHNIWQFSAEVFPPKCQGVMWSASISLIS